MKSQAARILKEMKRTRGYLHESHKILIANDPEFLRRYDRLYGYVVGREEDLPIKVRELIVIGLLSSRGEHRALALHLKRALEFGATPLEIIQALETAMFFSGAPTLIYGLETFEEVLMRANMMDKETKVISAKAGANLKTRRTQKR